MKTPELMQRLERHYLPPKPMPGGIFVPEVGVNGSFGASSRCDAIYVGFTNASGRILVGHEVKVSRGDWLTELGKPGKSDWWADQCHEWWLVTTPDLVTPSEVPSHWGLMWPQTSTKTRLKVIRPAVRKTYEVGQHQPSWDAVRSIIARYDTLQREGHEQHRRQVELDLRAEHAARWEKERDQLAAGALDPKWVELAKAIEAAAHRASRAHSHGYLYLDAEQVARAVVDLAAVRNTTRRITNQASAAQRQLDVLLNDQFRADLAAIVARLNAADEVR